MEACRKGNKPLVLSIIEKGVYSWEDGLAEACYGGHKDIILLMVEKGANKLDEGLFTACRQGNKDIAELMIDSGAQSKRSLDLDRGLNNACLTGQKELANYPWAYPKSEAWRRNARMIQKGVNFNRDERPKETGKYHTIVKAFKESQTNLRAILEEILIHDLISEILLF